MPVKLKKYIVCPYCGYHYDARKKRCPFCGTYIERDRDDMTDRDIEYVMEPARSPWKKLFLNALSLTVVLAVIAGVGFGCYKLYDKLMESVPKQEETEKKETIGTITVMISSNIIERDRPSVSADIVGDAYFGETYDVYETADAEGYTWYRIDEGTWIPDDGTWVKFAADKEK